MDFEALWVVLGALWVDFEAFWVDFGALWLDFDALWIWQRRRSFKGVAIWRTGG